MTMALRRCSRQYKNVANIKHILRCIKEQRDNKDITQV